jgi:hypothetical protein
MTPEEIRELADQLVDLSRWCYDRHQGDDQHAFLAAKAPRWASELRCFANNLEAEELAR